MKPCTTPPLAYRDGRPEEAAQLRHLAFRAWAAYEAVLAPSHWQDLRSRIEPEETYTALLQTAHTVVCETDDGTLAGMAFLVPSGHPTAIYPADWCYLRMVSVDPAYSGRGIGRALTEHCLQTARRTGERTVALHTSEMMAPARRLYESLGFAVVRELEPQFGKRYWLYQRAV